jgi:hypothetical protein
MKLLNTKYEVAMRTMSFPPEIVQRGFAVIVVKVRS